MNAMCILCKQRPATGRTTNFFCKRCQDKDVLVKMAALQRDTRFKEGFLGYQQECWGREEVLKIDSELSKHLQKKCVSFSREHIGYKELVEDVKEANRSIPSLIRAKVILRQRTRIELKEIKEKKKSLEETIKELEKDFAPMIEELEKIKDKKDRKSKKRDLKIRKEIRPLEDAKENLKDATLKMKDIEEELRRLKKWKK